LNQRRKRRQGVGVAATPCLKEASEIGDCRHAPSVPAPPRASTGSSPSRRFLTVRVLDHLKHVLRKDIQSVSIAS
jgi:hypothetical protein